MCIGEGKKSFYCGKTSEDRDKFFLAAIMLIIVIFDHFT